jgi:hypothetical protein
MKITKRGKRGLEITIERDITIDSPVEVTAFCLTCLDATDRLLGSRCNVVKKGESVFCGKTLGFWGRVEIVENKTGFIKYLGEAGKWHAKMHALITIEYSPTADGGTHAKCTLTLWASGLTTLLLKAYSSVLPVIADMMADDAKKVAMMIKKHPEKVKKILTYEQWEALQYYLGDLHKRE